MIETPITERLNYGTVSHVPNVLTPNIGILVVLLVGSVLWLLLGGVTFETTLSIVIHIPAWVAYLGCVGIVIAAVFGIRYLRDELTQWN